MFTGLIEAVGAVRAVTPHQGGLRIRVRAPFAGELADGESVAVDGVCLTVTASGGGEMQADVGPETMRVTTLGSLRPDQPVNLERAIQAGSRFGGHFVQGHVDATGTVEAIRPDGDAHWLTIGFPAALAAYFIPKGSVAVNGVSLTVAELGPASFDVMIIPFTWSHTSLSVLSPGARVNLECDMVGKYVARASAFRAG